MSNLWIGVSVENQRYARERIPLLAKMEAGVRFISYEPALGQVNFEEFVEDGVPMMDWIIVGGESGPGARPFDPMWAMSVVEFGKRHGVPIFVKQMGSAMVGEQFKPRDKRGDMAEWPEPIRVRQWPVEGPWSL